MREPCPTCPNCNHPMDAVQRGICSNAVELWECRYCVQLLNRFGEMFSYAKDITTSRRPVSVGRYVRTVKYHHLFKGLTIESHRTRPRGPQSG